MNIKSTIVYRQRNDIRGGALTDDKNVFSVQHLSLVVVTGVGGAARARAACGPCGRRPWRSASGARAAPAPALPAPPRRNHGTH